MVFEPSLQNIKNIRPSTSGAECSQRKIKCLKENLKLFKQQTQTNNEINEKNRELLKGLTKADTKTTKNKENSYQRAPWNSGKFKNCTDSKNVSKVNRDLIEYVKFRETYLQHVNHWQQIWLFTDNPIYEYENCEGFENPTYSYLNAKEVFELELETKLRSISSEEIHHPGIFSSESLPVITTQSSLYLNQTFKYQQRLFQNYSSVMNLYESILDGSTKQTNNESSNLVTSASIPAILSESKHNNTQLNRFFDSGLMSSPDSSDSGIHSDDLISRHNTLSASTTTEHLSTTSENKTSKDSLYSSVIESKKSTDSISREMSSLSSRLDSEEFDEENYNHLEQNELPLGWIRCCDETGVYYWHKPSGTVTRKPPAVPNKTETAEQIAPKLPKKNFKIDEYASFQQINELINGNLSDTNTLLSSSTASTSSTSESKQDMENNYYVNCNESTDDLVNLDSNQSLALNSERKGSNLFHSSSIMSQSLIAKVSQRFYVRSLGWVKIDEDDLTPERSSKAVNKCINDLSRGHKDLNDVVASWGEGKDLYMDLEDGYLILIDTNNYKVLNKQSITSIRVWGVGRDSGRDFAYVARDKQTKIHMCHVFRCDSSPAKEIANTLRDTCRQIISEKKKLKSNETPQKTSHLLKRPNFLPEFLNEKTALQKSASYQDQNELKASIPKSQTEVNSLKFLSPTEEPKKSIKCKYLGSTVVQKPTGIEILNAAIEKIYLQSLEEFKRVKRQYKLKNNAQLKPVSDFFNERNNNEFKDDEDDEEEDYEAYDYPDNAFSFDMPDLNRDKRLGIDVEVIVSPSTVSIKKLAVNDNYNNNTDNSILEFRVRYLSFMGISTDVRLCGFIVHGIDNTFKCHGFLCENSSGSLMKVIEAACRLRYQKCLDAHPGSANDVNSPKSKQNGRFGLLGTQLKGMFDSFKTRNIFSNYNLSELQQPK